MMKAWPENGSKTRVAHMDGKDFFSSERSVTVGAACDVRIEFAGGDGAATVLKPSVPLEAGEVIDTAVMNVAALRAFFARTIDEVQADGTLLSLHLKATMMKVSDPIMFGHCVSVYYERALGRHADTLRAIGANVNEGLVGVLDKLDALPADKRAEIEADIAAVYESQPPLAMVDSRKGITNLHVPNNVIIDASMPNVVRDGGRMWNNDDELQDTVAMIPDRSYATMYQAIIEDCQQHGQFDPSTMGSVTNVGLMARKAEEYGSHDKTFTAPAAGTIRVVDTAGTALLEQSVEPGDIFRMCQTKDEPIRDWVKLAVGRARAAGAPAVFWLNEQRRPRPGDHRQGARLPAGTRHGRARHPHHEAGGRHALLAGAHPPRREHDRCDGQRPQGLPDRPVPDSRAGHQRPHAVDRAAAAGRRPVRDRRRRLGAEARAADAPGRPPALGFARRILRAGAGRWSSQRRRPATNARRCWRARWIRPSRSTWRTHAIRRGRSTRSTNRGSTFYLALYWAQALAAQDEDAELKARFAGPAAQLADSEAAITGELLAAQGAPVDVGGYYRPDDALAERAMRPSATLNAIIDAL